MESLASIHDLALLHVFFYKWNHKLFNNSKFQKHEVTSHLSTMVWINCEASFTNDKKISPSSWKTLTLLRFVLAHILAEVDVTVYAIDIQVYINIIFTNIL